MPFRPFPIADLRSGLELQTEPWLGHPSAWREMRNAYVYQGRVLKRLGYEWFGAIGYPVETVETMGSGSGLGTAGSPWVSSFGAINVPIVPGSVIFRDTAAHVWTIAADGQVKDDGAGNLVHAPTGNVGTINYATGAFTINGLTVAFDANPTAIHLSYETKATTSGKGTAGTPFSFNFLKVFGTSDRSFVPGTLTVEDGVNYIFASNTHLRDDGQGKIVTAAGVQVGTVTSTGGTINGLSIAFAVDCWMSYQFRDLEVVGDDVTNAIMLIERYSPPSAASFMVATDRRRPFRWDEVTSKFERIGHNDLWSAEPEDFLWTQLFGANMLFVNGLDPCLYFNGTSFQELHTDWTTPAAVRPDLTRLLKTGTDANLYAPPGLTYVRKVDAARMVFRYKERCVLLSTKESGVEYPGRARFSKVAPDFSAGDTWNPNDYVDVPSNERIITARFIGDTLFAYLEKSVWKLVWRDDFRKPFEWVFVSDEYGSASRFASASKEGEVVALSQVGLIGCDGANVYRVGKTIPDLQLDWNQARFPMAYAQVQDQVRQVWVSFAEDEDEYPSHALVHQYEDDAYSIFDVPIHVLGEFQVGGSVLLWDQVTEPWNEYLGSFDDRSVQVGFPSVLMGTRTLDLFQLHTGFDDDAQTIPVKLTSNRLNPWAQEGSFQRARLGFFDLIGSAGADVTITVSFYRDHEDAPYLTKTVNLNPTSSSDTKRVIRFLVNKTARWHRFRIEEDSAIPWAIDAIVLHMMPAGLMRRSEQKA